MDTKEDHTMLVHFNMDHAYRFKECGNGLNNWLLLDSFSNISCAKNDTILSNVTVSSPTEHLQVYSNGCHMENPVVIYCVVNAALHDSPSNMCQVVSWFVWSVISCWFWALVAIMAPLFTIKALYAIWCNFVKDRGKNSNLWRGMFDENVILATTDSTIVTVESISCAPVVMVHCLWQSKTRYHIICSGESPWVVIVNFYHLLI